MKKISVELELENRSSVPKQLILFRIVNNVIILLLHSNCEIMNIFLRHCVHKQNKTAVFL